MIRRPAQHPSSTVDVDIVSAGELVAPTGAIIACDPLVGLADSRPFARRVAPGTYRVIVARLDGDNVYAAVVLQDVAPVRWLPALCEGEPPPDDDRVPGYSVDAGTGCFVDARTAAAWNATVAAWNDDNVRRVLASGIDPNDAEAWHAAMRARDAERPDLLARLRSAGYDRKPFASLAVDRALGGTIVAFTSGAGDGVYPSYWGVDGAGEPVVLLTDFGLLDRDDEEASEPEPPVTPSGAPGEPPFVRLATELLDRLVREHLVELAARARRGVLRDDLADMLATLADDGGRGAALAEWLSDRTDIEEVFASDEDLERLLVETLRRSSVVQ